MIMNTYQTDCLILGGGLAGWMAARETVRAGMKTMLLQDGMGASPWVHGFNAPIAHPEDSAEVFLKDTLKSGQGLSDPELAKALCGDAEDIFNLLCGMGLSFNREGDGYQALRPLGASYPRVVSIGNETGVEALKAIRDELKGKLDEIPDSRGLRLIKDGSRVCGALAYNTKDKQWFTVYAKAVVLASGGFCGIYPVSTNKRDSGGDGIAMAYAAGAELCDLEFVQFEPSAAVYPEALIGTSVITTLLFEGAVLRNRDGERFMLRYSPEGERVGKDVMSRRIVAEIASGKGTEHGGVYMDITGVGKERLESGYGMYVKRYKDVGIDISKEMIEIAPAPHTSLGGVRIDADGRTTVEGLFACGEVIGGLHGANRIGGSAGLETFVFGRRAGIAAAEYARSAVEIAADVKPMQYGTESIGTRMKELRVDMRTALWSGVNAVRNGKALYASAETLIAILKELDRLKGANDSEEFMRLRLRNDVVAGLLTAKSAFERDDSLGCHSRSDYPAEAKAAYRVVIKSDAMGRPDIRKELL